MPDQPSQPTIEISRVLVRRDERQRRAFTTEDLEASILELGAGVAGQGLLQPIVLTDDCELLAGERRLEACRRLGWERIPFVWLRSLSPIQRKIIELEENLKRKNLTWQETASAVADIHLACSLEDPEWTHGDTARRCSLERSTVSGYLWIIDASRAEPRLLEQPTFGGARGILERRRQRQLGDALEDLLIDPVALVGAVDGLEPEQGPEPEPRPGAEAGQPAGAQSAQPKRAPAPPSPPLPRPQSILQASFLDWAPSYTGQPFNLIHCDFPYGGNQLSGPQGRGAELETYDNGPEVFEHLLRALCLALPRLLSGSGHLMFWYGGSPHDPMTGLTHRLFAELAPQLEFSRFPLIWLKSDGRGIAPDHRRDPRHVYEICLLASTGRRQLVQVRDDAYASPTDRALHPSTKPEPMLRHFMSMLVDAHTRLLDPTCGSGASLRAAESLGAGQVLGLEINSDYIGPARSALQISRMLRSASRSQRAEGSGAGAPVPVEATAEAEAPTK